MAKAGLFHLQQEKTQETSTQFSVKETVALCAMLKYVKVPMFVCMFVFLIHLLAHLAHLQTNNKQACTHSIMHAYVICVKRGFV